MFWHEGLPHDACYLGGIDRSGPAPPIGVPRPPTSCPHPAGAATWAAEGWPPAGGAPLGPYCRPPASRPGGLGTPGTRGVDTGIATPTGLDPAAWGLPCCGGGGAAHHAMGCQKSPTEPSGLLLWPHTILALHNCHTISPGGGLASPVSRGRTPPDGRGADGASRRPPPERHSPGRGWEQRWRDPSPAMQQWGGHLVGPWSPWHRTCPWPCASRPPWWWWCPQGGPPPPAPSRWGLPRQQRQAAQEVCIFQPPLF
jgi:hypothetical protein